jgi:predicted histone-like DNA-binding protein
MPINYKSVSRKNPISPGDPAKFYANPVYKDKITLRMIADQIATRTTVHRADTIATLEAMTEVLTFFLTSGNIVSLGNFGSFRISIRSNGAETDPELTAANIKSYHLLFRPGMDIQEALNNLKAAKV